MQPLILYIVFIIKLGMGYISICILAMIIYFRDEVRSLSKMKDCEINLLQLSKMTPLLVNPHMVFLISTREYYGAILGSEHGMNAIFSGCFLALHHLNRHSLVARLPHILRGRYHVLRSLQHSFNPLVRFLNVGTKHFNDSFCCLINCCK